MNRKIFLLVVAVLLAFSPVFGALTSSLQVSIISDHSATVGLSTTKDAVGYSVNKTFSNGSGTTQVADLVYHASRTLSSAATENLDLAGSLTDAFGTTLTFVRVKSILIENTSASMTLTLGGDANSVPFFDPATSTVSIPPSGAVALVAPLAGWPVAAGTGDILKMTNSTGTATTYKIWVVGGSN